MSILGAIGGYLSGGDKVKGYKNAGNQATAVLDASKANSTYAPGGASAFSMRQNLLGLGDAEAGQGAFQNYLNSTGYRAALDSGNDAIDSRMAVTYGQKSGAADKARMRFGSGLGQQYFNNYFNQLGEQSDAGQRADEFVTGGKADAKWKQYTGMGEARAARTDSVFSGIGDAAGAVSGPGGNPWSNIWGG